jgi:CDP-diacylglycerol--glycerol-3-phosphate 3-phosphatidyltransferase
MDNRTRLLLVTFLTFVRLPLVLLFFAGALAYSGVRYPWLYWFSFLSLIASAVTDLFDGYLARKWNVVTRFGAHADPLMDKFFYVSTLPLLVFIATRNGHLWHAVFLLTMTLFFLTRDQWVTFLRSIGSFYNVSGAAQWSGKLRTCVNFPLICCIYHFEEAPFNIVPAWLLYAGEFAAFLINFISIYTYTRHYWPYLHRSARGGEEDNAGS